MIMYEIKRVLCSRKTFILFGMVLLLHGILFFYQCSDLKTNTLTGDELTYYIETYQEHVENAIVNSEDMLTNPLFSGASEFVTANLIKTGNDYKKLLGITPVLGENRGITTVLSFQLTGFAILLVGIYIVMSFLVEQKNGLFLLVRCTDGGRFKLTLTRIFTLAIGMLFSGFLLFYSIFIMSSIIFPSTDLSRPIQSIPEFSGVLSNISISTYLIGFIFKKTVACILICLLLYFLMSMLRSSLCIVLFILLAIAEYLLYALLLPTDSLCAFKYLNLYTIVFKGSDYGHYYNLNLFGNACGTEASSVVILLAGILLMTLLCIFRYSLYYPKVDHRSFKILEKISIFISKHKPVLTPTMWELKKILFSQKALVVLIITLVLAFSSAGELSYLDSRSPRLLDWYKTFYGAVDEEKMASLEDKQDALSKKLDRLEKSLVKLNEQYVDYLMKGFSTDGVSERINKTEKAIFDYKQNLIALDIIHQKASKGIELYRTKGILIFITDTTGYETLLDNDYLTTKQNYLYILIAVILMFSGVMACEKVSHMDTTLRTLYKGRGRLLARKLIIVFVISCICALAIHLIQLYEINKALPLENMEAPVQSIFCMMDFPLKMSIKAYLIALYAVRCLIAFGLSLIVMFISSKCRSRVSAIAFGVFFMIIPMVLI